MKRKPSENAQRQTGKIEKAATGPKSSQQPPSSSLPKIHSSPGRGPWQGSQEELNNRAQDLADWCKGHGFDPESIVGDFIQTMELCSGVQPIAIPVGVRLQRLVGGRFITPESDGYWYAGQDQNGLRALELISEGLLVRDVVSMQWLDDKPSQMLVIHINPWIGFTPKTMPIDYFVMFCFSISMLRLHPEASKGLAAQWKEVGFVFGTDKASRSIRVSGEQWKRERPGWEAPWLKKIKQTHSDGLPVKVPKPTKKILAAQIEECGTPAAVHKKYYSDWVRQSVYQWCDNYGIPRNVAKEDRADRLNRKR